MASASVWRRCADQARRRAACSARCRSRKSMARQRAGARKVGDRRARPGGTDAPCGSAQPEGQETTVARVIVTSSSGTSPWPPLLPVLDLLDRVDDVLCRRRPCRTRHSPSPAASCDLKFRKSLSAALMKNWAVAECGAEVRAIATRVLVVLQAVVGFVLDRSSGGLLRHAGLEAAALDHEALDHAVEHRAVVVAVLDVGRGSSSRSRGPWRRRARGGWCPGWFPDRLASVMSFLQGCLS